MDMFMSSQEQVDRHMLSDVRIGGEDVKGSGISMKKIREVLESSTASTLY